MSVTPAGGVQPGSWRSTLAVKLAVGFAARHSR
jgi:hypothetical protein